LVLLILYLSTLHAYATSHPSYKLPDLIPSIYAKPPDPFPAVTSFVESSSKDYHLDLTHISTNPGTKPTPSKARSHTSPPSSPEKERTTDHDNGSEHKTITFRDAFALYLDSHPTVRAIFVGTRRTDPHGQSLTHFDRTDGNWPDFMRVHPVIDWHLSEIWCFLRSPHLAADGDEHLDYCSMYDEGYTSLGGVGDTLRNPKLRYVDAEGREGYRPAYVLTEDGEERLGRE